MAHIAYSSSNCIGQFNLPYELIQDDSQRFFLDHLLGPVNGVCKVLHVEPHESGRGLLYVCASPLFQELNPGDEIPNYRLESACNMPFPNPEHEAVRINSGPFGFVAIRQTVVRVPTAQLTHIAKTPLH